MLADFTWWNVSTSIFAVTALLSTGAFIQKSRDNTIEIAALKERVTKLEAERTEVATLTVKMENMEERMNDLKVDMRSGFDEIKTLIRGQSRATRA